MFARFDPIGPADNEWNTGAGIERAVLAATLMLHGRVSVQQFESLVLITVVNDRPVVAAKYEDCIVGNIQAVEGDRKSTRLNSSHP